MSRFPMSKARSCGSTLLEQHEEKLHVQGQRNPSKMAGAGAVAVRRWSGCEEISHS